MGMRQIQLETSIAMIKDSPLSGVGYDYQYYSIDNPGVANSALMGFESVVFKKIVEQGAIGMASFLAILFFLYKSNVKYVKDARKKILFIGFFLASTMSFVFTGIQGRSWMYFFIFLLAMQEKNGLTDSDYIRLFALYNYGGIYLDMDVEVVKPFDPFLQLDTMLCFENSKDGRLEVAAFGAEKNADWIKNCLDYYENKHFVKENGNFDTKVLPAIIRDCLLNNNYELTPVETVDQAEMCKRLNTLPVFPCDFFSPKSYATGVIEKTERTYSIHHFAGTWLPWYCRLEKKICSVLGVTYRDFLHRHFCK